MMLYDSQRNVMRFHLLETCESAAWQAPSEVPMEGSIAGWVWKHQEAVVIRDLAQVSEDPIAVGTPVAWIDSDG